MSDNKFGRAADYTDLVKAVIEVIELHHREILYDAEVPVEGGRATVLEDVDYCAECGDLSGVCQTREILERALAHMPNALPGGLVVCAGCGAMTTEPSGWIITDAYWCPLCRWLA